MVNKIINDKGQSDARKSQSKYQSHVPNGEVHQPAEHFPKGTHGRTAF